MCKCDPTARALTGLAQVAYASRWPGYCRACNGQGLLTYSDDPSPAGVSLSAGTMTFSESCEACLCEGRCPRCGAVSYAADWKRVPVVKFVDVPDGDILDGKTIQIMDEEVVPSVDFPFSCVACGWTEDEGHGDPTPGMPASWLCECFEWA